MSVDFKQITVSLCLYMFWLDVICDMIFAVESDVKQILSFSVDVIIIIIRNEYDYGGVMSEDALGHLTNETVRRESQRDK